MNLPQLKRLIFLPASAFLLVAGGCHCLKGQNAAMSGQQDQSACQPQDPSCKVPPNGYVNTEEKDPKKARKNAKKDAKINADGCSPQCERVPLLKRIADKSNLESDIPVIKAAAKIKHQEEMCQQKVKAVKYLGTIGCCCYDKDGEVAKALLDALEDCLPAVRMAAVQAIGGCVCGQQYARSCCTDEIAEKLEEMGFKTDDKGCFLEPDPQIRQWAAYVSQNCQKKPKKDEKKKAGPSPIEAGKEGEDYENDGEMEKDKKSDAEPPQALPAQTNYRSRSRSVEEAFVDEEVADATEANEVASEDEAGTEIVTVVMDEIPPQITITFHQLSLDSNRPQSGAVCQLIPVFATPEPDIVIASADSMPSSSTYVAASLFPHTVGSRQKFPMGSIGLISASQNDSKDPFEANQAKFSQPRADVRSHDEHRAIHRNSAVPTQSVVAPPSMTQVAQSMPQVAAPEVTNRVPAPATRNANVQGRIESVDLENETAIIRLSENVSPGMSSRVHVVHKYALGRVQAIGEFEVLVTGPGIATIRPVAGTSLRKISVGDTATVFAN